MIFKLIKYFGKPVAVGCDAKCDKAWGHTSRPRVQLSADDDDFYYPADDELGRAPDNPGTYEGADAKPIEPQDMLNKWCVRECERCTWAKMGELVQPKSFDQRVYNQPSKHPEATCGD